ncbi:MAG: crossover junction endodeoxyribonuclease RuvC, partial [Hydrogenoanaerobacterium sp.]
MVIIGIDPGYAIVGYGVLDYTKSKFTTYAYGAV